ncbi:unnamed protein product [Mytilus edulis]|uniref:Uncharacterized protein n=1 Tax=Mytilus edulis TaxID=6550 RepID=A0A8S3TNF8_MYTED|nr:unnamed protein product [Mytilus edulis]
MHKLKIIVIYFMFSLFEFSAGMTEFPCYFPCPWHNQTFRDSMDFYYWTFNADGRTSILGDSEGSFIFRCHQITERFLILREEGTNYFRCFPINYHPDIPLEFISGGWNVFSSVHHTTAFTDLCAFCKVPDFVIFWTVATPLPLSLGCNRPSSCAPPGEVCNTSDTIPKACPTTTASPPTTTTDPKTTKSNCGKKQHTRSSA